MESFITTKIAPPYLCRMRSTLLLLLALLPSMLLAQRPVLGIVNADTIWVDAFARDVGRRLEYAASRGRASQPEVVQQTWTDEVERRCIRAEAQRRGMVVTDAMLDSLLVHDPPDYVRRGIQNAKGAFDPTLLEWMMRDAEGFVRAKNPNLSEAQIYAATQQLSSTMLELRSRFRDDVLRKTLKEAWSKSFVPDSSALMPEFLDQASSCRADVVMIPCASSVAPPTAQDVQQWYATHPERFVTQVPLRRLAYLSFPMVATQADSQSMLRTMQDFVKGFRSSPSRSKLDSLTSQLAEISETSERLLFSANDADGFFYRATATAKRGETVGPVVHNGGMSVLRVDSIRAGKNIARRVRRIVLPNDAKLASTSASILAAFTNGASFDSLQRAHSVEGADGGGMLILRGMLDAAGERTVFTTAVGRLTPAVNTGDASTLFYIMEESSRCVYVHAMTAAVQPSTHTVDSVLRTVDAAFAAYEGGEELGDVAKRFQKTVKLTPYVNAEAPVLGSYRLRDAAFATQVAAACDPIETPAHGVVLAIVADSLAPGQMPLPACAELVAKDWSVNERCRSRALMAQGMSAVVTRLDDGQLFISEQQRDMKVVRNTTISYRGKISNVGTDAALGRLVYATEAYGLLGPLQGDNGWYMVNVLERVPGNKSEYPMFLMLRGEEAFRDQRDAAFAAYVRSLSTSATIVDNRWRYFRY